MDSDLKEQLCFRKILAIQANAVGLPSNEGLDALSDIGFFEIQKPLPGFPPTDNGLAI